METHFRNFSLVLSAFAAFLFFQNNATAQQNLLSRSEMNDNIVMTWNKNTPESEMKDDIKALANKGITIKYSGVKRNSKDEITAIKVEYSDRKGNKGKMELENQSPIATIKFFKQDEVMGFGEPSNGNDMFGGNSFMNGFANTDDIMKQFRFNGNGGDSQSFSFSFPNDGQGIRKSKSQIRIQKDGKKPLVIEDGKVTEGGDDYSPEEIEEIKKNNRVEGLDFNNDNSNDNEFDFRNKEGLENFKKQMEKMQGDLNNSDSKSKEDFDKTKEEMIKAKEEMIKAREELENAKKELEKNKPKLKTQKA